MTEIVVAYDRNGVIGGENRLPWQGELPCDMQHFKEITTGKPVIMGRNTWDSIPEKFRPLDEGRTNIVLSMSMQAMKDVWVARSIEEALDMAGEEAMVIGGSQVYAQALPYAEKIHATEIEVEVEGGDTYFSIRNLKSNPEWEELPGSTDVHLPHGKNSYIHTFVTYIRRNPIGALDRSE